MSTPITNLGASASVSIGLPPVAAAGSVNGAGIDTRAPGGAQYYSALVVVQTGDATGSPTAQTFDVHVEESADNSAFTDITGAALTQVAADAGSATYALNLKGTQRYIRLVGVKALTGGTSPTWPTSAAVVLMGPDRV